ncbi:hypothetical protein [Achromobacter anxifer]|uniref:Uncharacterized protein n=1 Tax=Achromobacter anxifer TaxID=1287737 RepID=A0A6S7D923_9BURK|nr:hypothetical protein [Achromobacter anxifer]MDF8362950.1 hypothetical protein [Achromobacter anxifer]CAB3876748.1 hypothetical protein LMG26858_03015 [Achromobacter anxifer]
MANSLFGMLRKIGDLGSPADGAGALMATVPAGRNYYAEIDAPPDGAAPAGQGLNGEAFVPGQCYFSVRMVEMRLTDASNYIATFLPLCAFFLRYTEAGAQREIPYVVGYDAIQQAMGAAAPQAGAGKVVFRDVYIARNVPYNSDGLEMFAALCRFSDSSLTRGVLDFVATAVSMFGGAVGGAVVKAGEGLLKPLSKLFGTDGVSIRFGVFDGLALRRSGYRVLAGADTQDRLQGLQLVDGVLHRQGQGGALEPVNDVDYMVLAFEQRATLGDDMFSAAAALPFHRKWMETTAALLNDNAIAAKAAFQSLAVDIAGSPLLIEKDRFALLAAYASEREKWKAKKKALKSASSDGAGQNIAAAVADRHKAAAGRKSPVAEPLDAARRVLARSAAAGKPADPQSDASLAQSFASLLDALEPAAAGKAGKAGAAPAALSGASREMLSAILAETA